MAAKGAVATKRQANIEYLKPPVKSLFNNVLYKTLLYIQGDPVIIRASCPLK